MLSFLQPPNNYILYTMASKAKMELIEPKKPYIKQLE